MRMGAFLGDRRRLHQFAIDVLIDLSKRVNDLLRIILRDYGNGFLFSLRGLEAVALSFRSCMVSRLVGPVRLSTLAPALAKSFASIFS